MYGGHEAKFYYVGEAVYGTTPVAPDFLGIENVESVEPSVDPGLIKVRGIGSRDLAVIKAGLQKAGLKMVCVVPSEDVLNYMAYISTLYPYTVEIVYDKDGTYVILRYTGCRSDKLTVKCSVEDVVKATYDIIAQQLVPVDAKIEDATYSDFEGAIPFSEATVLKGAAGGTSLVEMDALTDWEFSIENNLKRVPVIRSVDSTLLKYLQERQRTLSGVLTLDFENKTQFYEAVNDSEFSLKFMMGAKYVLFTYCKWDSIGTPTKIEDLVSVKAPFTARLVEFSP